MTAITNPSRFGLELPDTTKAGTEAYVRDVLDPQIAEVTQQLELLRTLRRTQCSIFGIDRRETGSEFAQAHDRAKRAELEGDDTEAPDGRMRPARMRGSTAESAAADTIVENGRVVKSREGEAA